MRSIRAIRTAPVRGLSAALLLAAFGSAGFFGPGGRSAAAPPADGAAGPRWAVTVSAGKFDRRQTVLTFPLPEGAAPDAGRDSGRDAGRDSAWQLSAEGAGAPATPLQVIRADSSRRAVFVLADLKAGQSRTFSLEAVSPEAVRPHDPAGATAGAVRAVKEDGAVRVTVGGKEVLRYQGEKGALPEGFAPEFRRGGYIASVHTPAGRLVTDDYPPNHKHHHGIWSPWTKTEFEGRHPDFWNMGDKTGTVEFVGFGDVFSGPVVGGFAAGHRFIDLSAKPEPKAALDEQWRVEVYDAGATGAGREAGADGRAYFLFDWQSTQTCASSSPLTLLDYRYGGLGFRGNRDWDGAPNLTFLTSEGKEGRGANESRARWVYVGGQVEGQPAGVAILCSPDNFRSPQPVRIHPTEPFFCYAPSQLGDFKIEPGKPYVARYRFVVLDGKPDEGMKAEIERLWEDYAQPPGVEVKGEK